MKQILARTLLAAALTGGVALTAAAAGPQNLSAGLTEKGVGLAAHGYDVVSYFTDGNPEPGLGKFTAVHEGAAYRFASEAHLKAFQASPAKYVPQYGGFCAYGATLGKKFDGNPHLWKIVDGRLFFNLNEEVVSKWEADIPGNIAKADASWKTIR